MAASSVVSGEAAAAEAPYIAARLVVMPRLRCRPAMMDCCCNALFAPPFLLRRCFPPEPRGASVAASLPPPTSASPCESASSEALPKDAESIIGGFFFFLRLFFR